MDNKQKSWLRLAAQTFEAAGCAPLYLVGGFVRDTLLGRVSDDIDLAAPGTAAQVIAASRRFADLVNRVQNEWRASFLTLDPENGVARVVFQQNELLLYFDFAAFGQATSIEADLARRDFTINALAVPLVAFLANDGTIQNQDVIDVSGGLNDLQNSIVRAISVQNLLADPLRLLRGVRLKAQLSSVGRIWQIEPQTLALFTQYSHLITRPAPERTHEEINKLLLAANSERNLRLLDETGLLTHLLPELEAARGCVQMPGHYFDVFDHTLTSVDRIEWLTTPLANFFGLGRETVSQLDQPIAMVQFWPEIMSDLTTPDRSKLLVLRWATLLHDIGKPPTKQIDAKGEIHFYEHNRVGAEMARSILQRLRFSNFQVEQVGLMVQNHLRIGQLGENFNPQDYSGITDKATFRFLRDTAPVQNEMFLLSLADHAAVDGPRIVQPRGKYGWWRHLVLTDFFARKMLGPEPERVIGKPRLLDGKTLMQELNLPPGPKIGYLLREIEEAQGGGEISTFQEALSFARQLLQ